MPVIIYGIVSWGTGYAIEWTETDSLRTFLCHDFYRNRLGYVKIFETEPEAQEYMHELERVYVHNLYEG